MHKAQVKDDGQKHEAHDLNQEDDVGSGQLHAWMQYTAGCRIDKAMVLAAYEDVVSLTAVA